MLGCLLIYFECFPLWKTLCSIVSTQVLPFSSCIWRWHFSVWVKRQVVNKYFHMVLCSKAIDKRVSDWERATLVRESLWEDMTFGLRLENNPARCRETRAKALNSLGWRNRNKANAAETVCVCVHVCIFQIRLCLCK